MDDLLESVAGAAWDARGEGEEVDVGSGGAICQAYRERCVFRSDVVACMLEDPALFEARARETCERENLRRTEGIGAAMAAEQGQRISELRMQEAYQSRMVSQMRVACTREAQVAQSARDASHVYENELAVERGRDYDAEALVCRRAVHAAAQR